MARKQLIKGANAARVEARISRVPADLGADSGEAASSIFGALRAMEAATTVVPIEKPEARPSAHPKSGRLGPSDFSAVERETILRCCRDYRNRLPTYLLAVQKELKVLDSVIEKCRSASTD
jgi:hypothetical protein